MPGLPGVAALARGDALSALRGARRVAAGQRPVGVRACGRQASVTAGTIFDRTRTPLRLWFAAAWQMTSQKHGSQRWGPALAGAGLLPDRVGDAAPLSRGDGPPGPRATDGSRRGRRGLRRWRREQRRRTQDRDQGDRCDRRGGQASQGIWAYRLKHVPDVTAESLLPFIDEAVETGTTVHTDGWQAYWKLPDRGYEHERTVMRRQSEPRTS